MEGSGFSVGKPPQMLREGSNLMRIETLAIYVMGLSIMEDPKLYPPSLVESRMMKKKKSELSPMRGK